MLIEAMEYYKEAADGEWLSLPELQVSLLSRDVLYTGSLEHDDRLQVKQLDERFLNRAADVRTFLYAYGDPDIIFAEHPPQHWWWHIARIASGQMSVDLSERTVRYGDQTYNY